MSKIGEQRRQGDLLFIKVANIPEGTTVRKSGIILEGEATGHCHRVSPACKATVNFLGENMFVEALQASPTEIIHPEHDTTFLDSGSWSVVRQQTKTPSGWAKVED